jgi:hypothetical protein
MSANWSAPSQAYKVAPRAVVGAIVYSKASDQGEVEAASCKDRRVTQGPGCLDNHESNGGCRHRGVEQATSPMVGAGTLVGVEDDHSPQWLQIVRSMAGDSLTGGSARSGTLRSNENQFRNEEIHGSLPSHSTHNALMHEGSE